MFERIKKKLIEDVEKIGSRDSWNDSDLERMQKMTDTIKNICKINMLEQDEYETGGSARRGDGYAMRGRDSMGRFTRDGSYTREGSYRGMSRGHSYHGQEMAEELRGLMDKAQTEEERRAIMECVDKIER